MIALCSGTRWFSLRDTGHLPVLCRHCCKTFFGIDTRTFILAGNNMKWSWWTNCLWLECSEPPNRTSRSWWSVYTCINNYKCPGKWCLFPGCHMEFLKIVIRCHSISLTNHIQELDTYESHFPVRFTALQNHRGKGRLLSVVINVPPFLPDFRGKVWYVFDNAVGASVWVSVNWKMTFDQRSKYGSKVPYHSDPEWSRSVLKSLAYQEK